MKEESAISAFGSFTFPTMHRETSRFRVGDIGKRTLNCQSSTSDCSTDSKIWISKSQVWLEDTHTLNIHDNHWLFRAESGVIRGRILQFSVRFPMLQTRNFEVWTRIPGATTRNSIIFGNVKSPNNQKGMNHIKHIKAWTYYCVHMRSLWDHCSHKNVRCRQL